MNESPKYYKTSPQKIDYDLPGVGPLLTMPGSKGVNVGYYGLDKMGITRNSE